MMDGSILIERRPRAAASPARMVPLTAELYRFAVLEERDPLTAEMAEGAHVEALRLNPWGYALLGRGRVLAAAGLTPIWAGRASCWLLVSREARSRELVPALRQAQVVLDRRQRNPFFRRIEAQVRWDASYRPAFMRALGFSLEGIARRWDPAGRDYGLYSRVAEAPDV